MSGNCLFSTTCSFPAFNMCCICWISKGSLILQDTVNSSPKHPLFLVLYARQKIINFSKVNLDKNTFYLLKFNTRNIKHITLCTSSGQACRQKHCVVLIHTDYYYRSQVGSKNMAKPLRSFQSQNRYVKSCRISYRNNKSNRNKNTCRDKQIIQIQIQENVQM